MFDQQQRESFASEKAKRVSLGQKFSTVTRSKILPMYKIINYESIHEKYGACVFIYMHRGHSKATIRIERLSFSWNVNYLTN